MKRRFFSVMLAAVIATAMSVTAFAQTYAVQNPTYIPSARFGAITCTAACAPIFNVNNTNTISIQLTGTNSALAGSVLGSVDGGKTFPLTLALYGAPATSPLTAFVAKGNWKVDAAGLTNVKVNVTAITGTNVTVNMTGSISTPLQTRAGDVCENPAFAKLSVVVNVGAATTGEIVPAVAGETVYVCGWSFSLAGTTPSFTFKTGTKVTNACDTTPASLTGTILPTSGSMVSSPGSPETKLASILAGEICGTTAGSGSSAQGILTYVQM